MSAVSVMYWNSQGVYGKVNELSALIADEEIDFACISESHLTDRMQIKGFNGYSMIRNDRATHLGGLITLIKNNINFKEINLGQTSLLEYSAVAFGQNYRNIIINTYLPGGAKNDLISRHLKNDLEMLLKPYCSIASTLRGITIKIIRQAIFFTNS